MSIVAKPKLPWKDLRVLLRRASQGALRGFLRITPSEKNRIFFLTLLIGLMCGLAAVLFHLAIRFVEQQCIERAMDARGWTYIPWTIVTPMLGGLLGGLALEYLVPAARGSGVPQVKLAYAAKSGRLRLRDTIGKFAVSVVQIGTGASLGREGPTVQICAGVASNLGRLFALSPSNLRRVLPVGAAAGIAAAFNAPIAAVTFTIEEVIGDLDHTLLSGVVVAAAFAAVIERSVLGEHPVFVLIEQYGLTHVTSLVVYAALGLAAGITALAFSQGLLWLRKRFAKARRLPAWARPAVGGLVTGVAAAAVLAFLHTRGVTGGGYFTLGRALRGELLVHVLLILGGAKLIATLFSYASGGCGGIFAPTLFIGAMLGGSFGHLDQWLLGHVDAQTGAFALVGMGAVFAGVIRAPITSVLIIFEMTGSYGLVLPLMIANAIAYMIARRYQAVPIYEALLEQDGLHLPHRSSAATAMSALRVEDAMTTNLTGVGADETARAVRDRLRVFQYSAYPVVAAGKFIGIVSEARLRRAIAEGRGNEPVRNLVRPRDYLQSGQPLIEAVVHMNEVGARQMAVVSSDDPEKVVGILAISDVMHAHARAAADAEGRELKEPSPADRVTLAPWAPNQPSRDSSPPPEPQRESDGPATRSDSEPNEPKFAEDEVEKKD